MKRHFERWFCDRFPHHDNSILESSLKEVCREAFDAGSCQLVENNYQRVYEKLMELIDSGKYNRESILDFMMKHQPSIEAKRYLK